MRKDKDTEQSRTLEVTLNRLYMSRRKPSKSMYVLLVLLVFASSLLTSTTARTGGVVSIVGLEIPAFSFAGVFSSVGNICVILLAVFFGKLGYITALAALLLQLPSMLMGIIMERNTTSIPGMFGTLLTVIAIYVIYINNKRIVEYEKRIHDQATTDILTSLPNRFATSELVAEYIRSNVKFAAVSIDLNGFKSINDTMGFDSGNEVLVEIAKRWKKIADEGASGTLDFIARLAGDEFILIIREYESETEIHKTIQMYEEALNEKMTIFGCEFYVSASFGYALYPDDTEKMDSLLSYADAAMQEIKRESNSDHILRFTTDLIKSGPTLEMEGKIRDALKNDTIFFYLQPQYDMEHKLRGFEALARMKDEKGNLISPGDFIPVAEKVGLIDRVDGMVYKKAATFAGELMKKSGAEFMLSINVSVKHLMKNDFMDELRSLIQTSGISSLSLEIEITESIMIESMDKAMSCIQEIRDMGIRIAIDDFGTGYSSLSYLNNFPANLLKIDKSFIDNMNVNDKSKQYVAAIISLGHSMGFEVISEGVEDTEQLETLREIGCDLIQGYIWGKPLPPEEAEKVVMESLA